ncbi:MAG: hypothetical protein WBV77_13250 [Solirubrobacteraceae bacterium]
MSLQPTEGEIFSLLSDSLRLAADRCRKLAWHPRRGHQYNEFRQALEKVENACRMAYYWRNYDARWLYLAMQMPEIHRRAGNWIRGKAIRGPDGVPVYDGGSKGIRQVAHPMFAKLAEMLEKAHRDADRLKTMATFRVGMILPKPLPGPHRDTKPIQVITPGGVIIPSGVDLGERPAV